MGEEEYTADDAIKFVTDGMERLREELDCAIGAFKERDFGHLTNHLTNIAYGCQVTAKVLVQYLVPQNEIIELMRQKLQETYGKPVHFVGEAGPILGFQIEDVEVPNDLSELDNGE